MVKHNIDFYYTLFLFLLLSNLFLFFVLFFYFLFSISVSQSYPWFVSQQLKGNLKNDLIPSLKDLKNMIGENLTPELVLTASQHLQKLEKEEKDSQSSKREI